MEDAWGPQRKRCFTWHAGAVLISSGRFENNNMHFNLKDADLFMSLNTMWLATGD